MSLPALKNDDAPVPEGFYGWRPRLQPDGTYAFTPRTLEEFLHPQEGDEMSQDSLHAKVRHFLVSIFLRWIPEDGNVQVFDDMHVEFRTGETAAPDVCLVEDAETRDRRSSFLEAQEPGRMLLAVEVVSPNYAFKDYEHNPGVYARAGVPEYLIIDPQVDTPFRIYGYRLHPMTGRYDEIPFNAQGQLHLRTVDLLVAVDPDGWGIAFTDPRNGERVLTDAEAAEAEARRAEAEARRAEALAEENERLRKLLDERS